MIGLKLGMMDRGAFSVQPMKKYKPSHYCYIVVGGYSKLQPREEEPRRAFHDSTHHFTWSPGLTGVLGSIIHT